MCQHCVKFQYLVAWKCSLTVAKMKTRYIWQSLLPTTFPIFTAVLKGDHISTILSLTPTATYPIICNMPIILLLVPSGAMYFPFNTLEVAVVLSNSPKSCCSFPDHMDVPFVSLNLCDNDFCSPDYRRSFPSYLWYILLWYISSVLTIPNLLFFRSLPMMLHVFLAISLIMIFLIYFSLLIFPHATFSFNQRANNLAL